MATKKASLFCFYQTQIWIKQENVREKKKQAQTR
jgi:hypothetical protein